MLDDRFCIWMVVKRNFILSRQLVPRSFYLTFDMLVAHSYVLTKQMFCLMENSVISWCHLKIYYVRFICKTFFWEKKIKVLGYISFVTLSQGLFWESVNHYT